MKNLSTFEKKLNLKFKNKDLFYQALIHRSYLNEHPTLKLGHNERLEFLGDAVLDLVVAEQLYQDFPHFSEGEMTRPRAALVCRNALSRMAKAIGLGDYLYLGKGEEAGGGRRNPANLAGAMEAVIAAIFLDRGLAVAGDFVLNLLDEEITKIISRGTAVDYKSRLQEIMQSSRQLTPAYRVVDAVGPDHDRRFTVEVTDGDTVLGRGSGRSKKLAEMDAARSALERLSAGFTP